MEKILNESNPVSFENERTIANILHDIKSPLYSIKIALQSKLESELNRDIYETTTNVIKYIENFLVNYNFKIGKFEGNPAECDILGIIKQKIENYKYLFINKKIRINVVDEINKNYKVQSVMVFLSSIIGNIISNIAFHACENKEAEIKLERKKNYILASFQNDYSEQNENFSLGLEFCKKLSKLIKVDMEFNKSRNKVKVELKIPDLSKNN